MDHLILPTQPIRGLLEFPLLDLEGFDGNDFESFPERDGWHERTVAEWQIAFRTKRKELSALFQKWLYFGYLQMSLNRPIDIKRDFRRLQLESDDSILTTK